MRLIFRFSISVFRFAPLAFLLSRPMPTTTSVRVGRLALTDGSVFTGTAFGAVGKGLCVPAEVVFNTAMTGYQEALTDPSYTGQILVMTYPLMGNYGINAEDVESKKVQVSGFIIRQLSRVASNYRHSTDLSTYLEKAGALGLADIDTRALTRRLREKGVMTGVITDKTVAELSDAALVEMARKAPSMAGQNLVPAVGCNSGQSWTETLGDWSADATHAAGKKKYKVLALDCGAKQNILRNLADRGCEVKLIPHDTPASDITRMFESGQADGLFISNGPGDPAAVDATIRTLKQVVAMEPSKVPPTFGICLGHQLLGLAVGAKTYKLPFGHRGANQPVKNLMSGKVEITSQNHGFAVDPESLKSVGGEATHVHLNDGTLAGFRLKDKPVFCVQYHPEAAPGPHDSAYLFDAFVEMMGTRKPVQFA